MSESEHKIVKKRNRGHNKRIGFSEETVPKDVAKTLLSKESTGESKGHTFLDKLLSEDSINNKIETPPKKPKKRIQIVPTSNNELTNDENTLNDVNLKSKKKKRNQEVEVETNEQEKLEDSEKCATNGPDKALSKRAAKRFKYQKILENRREESHKTSQQNALNYLSNWKYNKSEWKFEKLKQIWLIQNLYDSSKLEDKYWDAAVEYFANSQGKVHQEILEKAIKIIENDEIELNDQVKFKRARDIVQHLQ